MRKGLIVFGLVLSLVAFHGCQEKRGVDMKLAYPATEKVDQVDDYFGTKISDPYRWLEDDNAPAVKEWVKVQNELTFSYLEKIPFRNKINQRLREIYNYPRYSSPFRAGEYYFFYKNDGLQNQSVCYIQKGLEGQPEIFLDPNLLSADGTIRASILSISNDNRYAAISRGEAGSDWMEIRIMDIASKQELPDRIRWVKFSDAAWFGDGFFYCRYDQPAPGEELKAKNEYMKVYYHKLGQPQEKDTLIYEDSEHPLRMFGVGVTEDEKAMFLVVTEGTHGNELYWKDLTRKKAKFEPVITGFEFNTSPLDVIEGKIFALTNVDAPNYRVVLIDPRKPQKENWQTIISEKSEVLASANLTAGFIFTSYLKDANSKIFQHKLDGSLVREILLPTLGTAGGFVGRRDEKILFYTFTSFTYPPSIYKFDPFSGQSEVFRTSEVKFNPADYETRQVFYTSKDGTRVPMFIVFKKGLKLNAKNPTYLYGYGGFNISLTPAFNPGYIVLLENGGIFAQANIRGGGEYGEDWHKAGMLEKKQNVFDDFIAAAEYLIREKYTSPKYMAIAGASNGGLLVGACMTQRPDLYRVVFPAVGVLDMLRYHKFTIGYAWAVEYGSSNDEKAFKYLYAYSPLHNLKDGISYPATLITTADHDDRVVPAHSFKFAATLQEKHSGSNPVLIRIETRSGHGASNITKAIDELTDRWAFMFYNMNIEPRYK